MDRIVHDIIALKKEFDRLRYQCDLKKRELTEHEQRLADRNKQKEREYSALVVKKRKINKEIEDVLFNLSETEIAFKDKKAELFETSRKINAIDARNDELTVKERSLNTLGSILSGKERKVNKDISDFKKTREVFDDEVALFISELRRFESFHNDVTRKSNDVNKTAKRTEELFSKSKEKASTSERILSEIRQERHNIIKKKKILVEHLEEAIEKKNEADRKLAVAEKSFFGVKKKEQENESILRGLKNYKKELDYKKLQIDAIIKRKKPKTRKRGKIK